LANCLGNRPWQQRIALFSASKAVALSIEIFLFNLFIFKKIKIFFTLFFKFLNIVFKNILKNKILFDINIIF
jgi:hypothetical protein